MKDPEHLIKVEKAIQEKYGDEAIQNPKANWDPAKEKEYLQQIKKIAKSEQPREKIEVDGVLISKKLLNREHTRRSCPVCREYSFNLKDDAYMSKFDCCYKCYIEFIQGNQDGEEKWLSGWRPKKLQEKN